MSDIDDFKSYLESHQAAFSAWGKFKINYPMSFLLFRLPIF